MKKMMALTLLALSFSAFTQTEKCTYNYSSEGSTLAWTAFKTPKKVGVGAKFSDFTIFAKKDAASLSELLTSATFEVNSQSVNSGDKARDAKIAQFFFKKMLKGTKITGKVLKATDDKVEVELMLNGTTKVIEMKPAFDEANGKLNLTGKVDVLEFGMKDNLATLTKACFEKHEGVTWPDVDLSLVSVVTKNCK